MGLFALLLLCLPLHRLTPRGVIAQETEALRAEVRPVPELAVKGQTGTRLHFASRHGYAPTAAACHPLGSSAIAVGRPAAVDCTREAIG